LISNPQVSVDSAFAEEMNSCNVFSTESLYLNKYNGRKDLTGSLIL
jgi:hypothetical protein